jgi:hypothetical protein
MIHNASVFIPLLWTSIIIGFAYLVWVQAAKESGSVKMIGQIISVVMLIFALISLGVSFVQPRGHGMRGEMRRPPMMGNCPMIDRSISAPSKPEKVETHPDK